MKSMEDSPSTVADIFQAIKIWESKGIRGENSAAVDGIIEAFNAVGLKVPTGALLSVLPGRPDMKHNQAK